MKLPFLRSILLAIAFACLTHAETAQSGQTDPYAELATEVELAEIMRHLYRWNLDPDHFDRVWDAEVVEFFVLPRHPELDADDHSLFADIIIPQLGLSIRMKKTDYVIEELGIEVSSDRFKMVHLEHLPASTEIPSTAHRHAYPWQELQAYLFDTRYQLDPPGDALLRQIEHATRGHLSQRLQDLAETGDQTIHVSPLSPVANEVWIFWEEGNVLIHWSSDLTIADEAIWEHEHMALEVIDIEKQVLLSFSHRPGSNAYYTRDQIGRILYNCLVFGQKRTVPAGEL